MVSFSKFTASADKQARFKCQYCIYSRFIEVMSILPTKAFAEALLTRMALLEFRITASSIEAFMAAVMNKDVKDWGRYGSSAHSKIWVFELVSPVPFVVNEHYAELSFSNYGDTIFTHFILILLSPWSLGSKASGYCTRR